MTRERGGDELERWQNRDSLNGAGREVVARFAVEEQAQDAALALRRAGYPAEVAQERWEPVGRSAEYTGAPVLLGVAAGMITGIVLAMVWWWINASFSVRSGLTLPIGRALGAAVIYIICTALGAWLGYRWARDAETALATTTVEGGRERYAVAVPLPETERQEEEVRRILEEHAGRNLVVRRAA